MLKRWAKNPPDRTEYVRDSLVRGLQVRRNRDGSLTWVVRRRLPDGTRPWKIIGHWPIVGPKEARDRAVKYIAGVADVGPALRRGAITWADLVENYRIEATARGNRSVYKYLEILGRYPESWKHRTAEGITWLEFRAEILRIGADAPGVAISAQNFARTIYSCGMDASLVDTNPLLGRRMLFKLDPEKRVFTYDEIRRLWEAWGRCGPGGQVLKLMLLSGARQAVVRQAKWEFIRRTDRGEIELRIPGKIQKSKRDHVVLLTPLALEVVDQLETRGHSPYLFPHRVDLNQPRTSINPSVVKSRQTTGIEDWRPHNCRHTFLSFLAEARVDDRVVKVMADHSLPGVSDKSYIERRRYWGAAAEAWLAYDRLLSGIIRGEFGKVVELGSRSS